MAERKQYYLRFTLVQRAQHWLMTLSFTMLAVTGLPQRYALAGWAEWMIAAMGGIETVRIIHRVSAVVFILVTLYHFVLLAYRVLVLRVEMSMLPGLKDVTDMLDAVRYNLGLARRHPRLPRYTFAEKIEYWSLIWGSVLMIVTGFILWNPVAMAGLLPGEFIPAAKTAHSAEALLAVLAVAIWHFYSVHVKTFNRSMFTGKLTRDQMEAEHAAELEMLDQGRVRPPLRREVKRVRERVFLPVATVGTLAMLVGVYTFVTFEQTAITTVPPAETAVAFVPATPTPTPTATATPLPTATPPPTATSALASVSQGTDSPTAVGDGTLLSLMVIPHEVEGRENCLMCHAEGGALAIPEDHAGRPNTTCLVCHATTTEEEHLPVPVKHDLEGRENCQMCHAADVLPQSHKTGAFSNSDCLLCHEPASAVSASGSATQPAAPAESSTATLSFAQDVLPAFEAKCSTCHGSMALGGLQLTDYQLLMAGGQDGPVVVSGSPDESPIVTTMRGEHSAVLSVDELQSLVDWIDAGAEDN
jgi:cytochrome b subunit of formate dehydrogenase